MVLRAENYDVLRDALMADASMRNVRVTSNGMTLQVSGTRVTIVRDGSTLRVDTYDEANAGAIANTINRAYSTEVVKVQAKKFGWNLQQTDGGFTAKKRLGMGRMSGIVLACVLLGATGADAHHEQVVVAVSTLALSLQYIAAVCGIGFAALGLSGVRKEG